MIRLTRRVFTDLAVWMTGFGMVIGFVFPFFVLAMGVPASLSLSWWFILACVAAGLFVGAINISLARTVVGKRLKLLADRMVSIEGHLKEISGKDAQFECTPAECYIPVDSEDELGDSARSFNSLVDTLSKSLQTEIGIRNYTQMLTSHLEIDVLCRHALDSLVAIAQAQGGAILIEDSGEMRLHASLGIKKSETLVDNQLILNVLKTEKRNIIEVPEGILLDGVVADFRPREIVLEPIQYKQIPLGVLILASARPFGPEIRGNLDLFSKSLALALHNAMTHDQVQKLAAIDPLTGIYNRRFGTTRLHEEFVRAVQLESAIGIMMFDIDHFKSVNDTYGHSIGDRVIRQVATTARSALREGDIIIRLGGDEFLAVLLGASANDVFQTAEKIRRQIDEKLISYGDQNIHITVSLGGVSFPEKDVKNEQDLIDSADRALYSAKNAGRNRTVV
jgi:diguanylate cyclase (GGDEF)-like protein